MKRQLYLLHGVKLDNVLVVELPQHVKLPHLHLMSAVVARQVENFDGYQLTRPLNKKNDTHNNQKGEKGQLLGKHQSDVFPAKM